MHIRKHKMLGALATLIVALAISMPVLASGASASQTVTSASSSANAAVVLRGSLTPLEKAHLTFSGYSYADTSAGKNAAEQKGIQLVDDGWGISYQIVFGDPDEDRWCVWILEYL